MFIKKKHTGVIIFSSIIISIVFVSTVIGYGLYIRWKNETNAFIYRRAIYSLTAEVFRPSISMTDINVVKSEKPDEPSLPMFQGHIKNNSPKSITSLLVEITFLDVDGAVIYKDQFDPLSSKGNKHPLFFGRGPSSDILAPGAAITFNHILRSCPPKVLSQISTKKKFVKSDSRDKLNLDYFITGISVL